jgi:hypothetical protein
MCRGDIWLQLCLNQALNGSITHALLDTNCSCYCSPLQHPFYRQLVARLLPSVDKLDNMEVTPQVRMQRR